MVWKIRVGKRFKERGQGLSRGMQCGGTRVQDLAGALVETISGTVTGTFPVVLSHTASLIYIRLHTEFTP